MSLADRFIDRAQRRPPDFVIGGAERPYLLRWWLIPRNRFFNVYLHCFLRSDDDRALHDHPWLFNASWLLRGVYVEHTAKGSTRRTAGDFKFRWGRAAHRVELCRAAWAVGNQPAGPFGPELKCWTLFVTGRACANGASTARRAGSTGSASRGPMTRARSGGGATHDRLLPDAVRTCGRRSAAAEASADADDQPPQHRPPGRARGAARDVVRGERLDRHGAVGPGRSEWRHGMTAEPQISDTMRRAWQAMSRRPKPRNLKSLDRTEEGGLFVVSFIGETPLAEPHVFVDGGTRYDWRFAAGLQAVIVVREGIRAAQTMADLFDASLPYPTLVDFDRKDVASIVSRDGGRLQFWPRRRGSEQWRALFG
jgi:hypothetical protein